MTPLEMSAAIGRAMLAVELMAHRLSLAYLAAEDEIGAELAAAVEADARESLARLEAVQARLLAGEGEKVA